MNGCFTYPVAECRHVPAVEPFPGHSRTSHLSRALPLHPPRALSLSLISFFFLCSNGAEQSSFLPPIDLLPLSTPPRFFARAPSPTPPPSSPTPGQAPPRPNRRQSKLLRPFTIGAAQSLRPPSICSLRPFLLAPDPKNRFPVSPQPSPPLFPLVYSPERCHTPPARPGPDHLAYGRIIRHLPEAKIIVGPDHPAYGRIIRPWELFSNPKPKLSGDGRIIRPYFGSPISTNL